MERPSSSTALRPRSVGRRLSDGTLQPWGPVARGRRGKAAGGGGARRAPGGGRAGGAGGGRPAPPSHGARWRAAPRARLLSRPKSDWRGTQATPEDGDRPSRERGAVSASSAGGLRGGGG